MMMDNTNKETSTRDISFGIESVGPTDCPLFLAGLGKYKVFGIDGDCWKIVSVIMDYMRYRSQDDRWRNRFTITPNSYAYAVLRLLLVDLDTSTDELSKDWAIKL